MFKRIKTLKNNGNYLLWAKFNNAYILEIHIKASSVNVQVMTHALDFKFKLSSHG